MNADQYIRKYLAGTLTEPEMILFRELMERSPEYRSELRQLLDLRSLIHDDSLKINVPESLSENTRFSVAARFAMAAHAEEASRTLAGDSTVDLSPVAVARKKRRGAPLPFRISALALVVLLIGAITALTPTHPLGGGIAALNVPSEHPVNNDGASSAPASVVPVHLHHPDSDANHRRHIGTSPVVTPNSNVPHSNDSKDSNTPAIQNNTVLADNSAMPSEIRNVSVMNPPVPVSNDAIGSHSLPSTPPITAAQRGLATGSPFTSAASIAPQNVTFGVTVGSGLSSQDKHITALMQNSYYLTVALNSTDRIGIETGFSALGTSKSSGKSSGGAFGKVTAGAPQGDNSQKDDNGNKSGSSSSTSVYAKAANPQISYGAVYYDKRFAINRSWDVCARVGVGATDNAFVGSTRVYAGYAPSANIKLTAGVGASGLRTFDKVPQVTGNIGIYYGLEAGF